MKTETLIRNLSIGVLACGVIVGCGEKTDAPEAKASIEDVKEAVKETFSESNVAKYGRLYSELLKQKQAKEGLTVNIGAETKKKVAAFRQASPEARAKLLKDLEKQVNEYRSEQ